MAIASTSNMAINYPMPGPGPGPAAPNYEDTYGMMGLAGLGNGFTHGLELGQKMGQAADTLQMHKDQMADNAAYRAEQTKQLASYHEGELKNRADMVQYMKDQAEKIGTPVYDDKGNVVAYQTGRGGLVKPTASPADKNAQKTSEALNSAVAAYMAMDNARKIGTEFMPESSGFGAMLKAPFQKARQLVQQTSPENNLADKSGEAATLFATAVNKAGGGRMTEAEVENMKKAMGGNGVGDTIANIDTKHDAIKNELAAKTGLSRKQIEDAVAARNEGGAGLQIGAIQDGHVFKGGNPADPKSWEKQ